MKISFVTLLLNLLLFVHLGKQSVALDRAQDVLVKEPPNSDRIYDQTHKRQSLPNSAPPPYQQIGKAKNNFDSRTPNPSSTPSTGSSSSGSIKKKPKSSRSRPTSSKSSKGSKKDGTDSPTASPPPHSSPSTPTPPPNSSPSCISEVANALRSEVPDIITLNPERCCGFAGPVGVFVTHSQGDNTTSSGLELYWENFYFEIDSITTQTNVCFVFTGVGESNTNRSIADVLSDVITAAAAIDDVQSIMTTDPTSDIALVSTVRQLTQEPSSPSIGVFNAGSNNIIVEAIVSGMDRLPFIGSADDAAYGTQAAAIVLQLQGNETEARPLCLNARPDVDIVGQRCEAFYEGLGVNDVSPTTGIVCGINTTADQIASVLVGEEVNSILAHVDCCTLAADAIEIAQSQNYTDKVILGCTDEDTTGARVDFVTRIPLQLQAYSAASWIINPVLQSLDGKNGRSNEFFPDLRSFLNTAVYNYII